jgi:hypothetical protein
VETALTVILANAGMTTAWSGFANTYRKGWMIRAAHAMSLAMTRRTTGLISALLFGACLFVAPSAHAQAPPVCRMVGDVPSATGEAAFIRIDPAAAARMAEIGLDRAGIFARMAETAIPKPWAAGRCRRAISTAS